MGLQSGDVIAQYFVELPSDAAFGKSTVSYQQVFHSSAEELRALFNNKVIVVGDLRAGRDGPRLAPGGRKLHGCVPVCAAIDSLISGTPVLWPRLVSVAGATINAQFLADAVALILAFTVGAMLSRRNLQRRAAGFVMALACVVIVLIVYRLTGHIFTPLVGALACIVGMELVAGICRARPSALG